MYWSSANQVVQSSWQGDSAVGEMLLSNGSGILLLMRTCDGYAIPRTPDVAAQLPVHALDLSLQNISVP